MFALALLVPLFFDWLADLLVHYLNPKKKDTADEMVTDFQKALLFVSLAGAPCLTFVASANCDTLALLWFCLTRFQVVAVLGTFRVCLSKYDSRVWTWWSTMLSGPFLSSTFLILTIFTFPNPTPLRCTLSDNYHRGFEFDYMDIHDEQQQRFNCHSCNNLEGNCFGNQFISVWIVFTATTDYLFKFWNQIESQYYDVLNWLEIQ